MHPMRLQLILATIVRIGCGESFSRHTGTVLISDRPGRLSEGSMQELEASLLGDLRDEIKSMFESKRFLELRDLFERKTMLKRMEEKRIGFVLGE